ncbi:MAG: hypothetical protein WCP34_15325, partial [Pseudomonadota bacterium]
TEPTAIFSLRKSPTRISKIIRRDCLLCFLTHSECLNEQNGSFDTIKIAMIKITHCKMHETFFQTVFNGDTIKADCPGLMP